MRDIKFRAWDNSYKYMNYKILVGIYGDWEQVKDDNNYTSCAMWIEPKNVDYKCEPHWGAFEPYHENIKLMQYIGLKDRNGKEIYEGDIVKIRNKNYKVIYDKYTYMLENFYCTCNDNPSDAFEDLKEFEVIGNIYENKELLN